MRNTIDLEEIGQPDEEIERKLQRKNEKKKAAKKVSEHYYGVGRHLIRVILRCPIRPVEEEVEEGVIRLDIEPKGDIVVMKWWTLSGRQIGWFTLKEWIAVLEELSLEIKKQNAS